MTTALAVEWGRGDASPLRDDLEAAGVHVIGAPQQDRLVRDASSSSPDVVVIRESSPGPELVATCQRLMETAPCPIVVFTNDPDADRIGAALHAGVAAYVVNGYEPQRLRGVIQVAQARFRREQDLRAELADVNRRFEERKLVDKAKGILMRARQLSEDEAFRVLRSASMHSHRRVGQVSQQVIDAARYAEAVNRAGQLRALSQRLVKLYTLRMQEIEPLQSARLMAESITRIDLTIGELPKRVSTSTYGDLLDAVTAGWAALKAAVLAPLDRQRLAEVDALAEQLLRRAEQLTFNLESSGLVTTLHVINVSGRQRMLSQRYAKLGLMAAIASPADAARMLADARSTADTFDATLRDLAALPLSNKATRDLLDAAASSWSDLQAACAGGRGAESQWAIATASEALLTVSQTLTDEYERSMQVLMG